MREGRSRPSLRMSWPPMLSSGRSRNEGGAKPPLVEGRQMRDQVVQFMPQ